MHAVHATALLLLLTASAAKAAEWSTPAFNRVFVAAESSPRNDSGTGAPSTDNAGTGSTSSTASPS